MSWGKPSHGPCWGPHRHSVSSGIFFLLITHLLTSSFSRVANNFLWIARMCSAPWEWRINRRVSVVPFAPHNTWMLWKNRRTSGACCLHTYVWGCIHMNPAPLPTLGRSERFRRQTSYVHSHTLCSWGRDKFLQLHKMLGLKLCIIVLSISSILCVFKFCCPGQCNLLQLTCNLLHWALSSLHLRREAIIDLWKRCPT